MHATGQEIRNVAINRTGVGSWGFQTDTCRQFPEVNRLEEKRVADYAVRRRASDVRDSKTQRGFYLALYTLLGLNELK